MNQLHRLQNVASFLAKGIVIILFVVSINNALIHSQDFQWSVSRTLLYGYNPFELWLSHQKDFFLKAQIPDYPHIYYFLLIPFACLPETIANFCWALLNIGSLIACVHACRILFGISNKIKVEYFLLLMISGFPARNAIGNGQASIFVLTTMLGGLFLIKNKDSLKSFWGAIVYGLSYTKYAFMPAFSVFTLVTFGWQKVLLTLIPLLSGAFGMLLLFQNPSVLLQPTEVSSQSMLRSYGMGDLLSVINYSSGGLNQDAFRFFGLFCSLINSSVVWLTRKISFNRWIAITTMSSLMFLTHIGYDYVFMAIVIAFALSDDADFIDRFIVCVGWVWIGYIYKLLVSFGVSNDSLILPSFILNVVILITLIRPGTKSTGILSDSKDKELMRL